jgi:23S rRNA pseudouridine1911/1915/1917 synthase
MSSRVYHIDDRLDGQSLAQAIKHFLPDRSWSDVKRLIANRHIQIHGNLCLEDGRRLRSGDVVKVFDEPLARPPAAEDLVIVHRDAHLVIVEKPAGVTTQREPRETHQGRAQRQATLDELLQAALDRLPPILHGTSAPNAKPQAAGDGFILKRRSGGPPASKPSRPPRAIVRPVHRLDRDTSGLMVFALSPDAESKLVAEFKRHAVERIYRAVVVGHVAGPMRIESMIARDRGDGLRGSSDDPHAPDRQRAVTHVRPVETIGDGRYTVVECRLETGRTHQIRIHLAEQGHMLCGERTYNRPAPGQPPTRDPSEAPRHALHSARLSLAHPITGERIERSSEWPRDLANWLKRLHGASGASATLA